MGNRSSESEPKQNDLISNTDKTEIIESESKSKPKPRKQSKSKSKKAKSKQNKSPSNNNYDYLQLKKQYEGMVKLWNEERANLKKAQQILRNQKDSFKVQQESLENANIHKINEISSEYQQQIKSKNKIIESLEASLLKLKEERNNKIEDGNELNEKIKELEAEKYEILKEKSSISLEKQEQIELIRKEFDLERKNW